LFFLRGGGGAAGGFFLGSLETNKNKDPQSVQGKNGDEQFWE
jgi:hypothetical protein